MTRPQLRYSVTIQGSGSELVVVQNARVDIFRDDGVTHPTMWTDASAGVAATGPFITDAFGRIGNVWLDATESPLVRYSVSDNFGSAYRANLPRRLVGFAPFVERILLASVGPAGPAGGATGPTGPPSGGPTGPTGPAGGGTGSGVTGPTGHIGPTGPAGGGGGGGGGGGSSFRPQLIYEVTYLDPATATMIAVQNALVDVFRVGTIVEPLMWDDPLAGSVVHNAQFTDDRGMVVVWLDTSESPIVDVVVADNGAAYRAGLPASAVTFTTYLDTLTLGNQGPTGPAGGPTGPTGSGGYLAAGTHASRPSPAGMTDGVHRTSLDYHGHSPWEILSSAWIQSAPGTDDVGAVPLAIVNPAGSGGFLALITMGSPHAALPVVELVSPAFIMPGRSIRCIAHADAVLLSGTGDITLPQLEFTKDAGANWWRFGTGIPNVAIGGVANGVHVEGTLTSASAIAARNPAPGDTVQVRLTVDVNQNGHTIHIVVQDDFFFATNNNAWAWLGVW